VQIHGYIITYQVYQTYLTVVLQSVFNLPHICVHSINDVQNNFMMLTEFGCILEDRK